MKDHGTCHCPAHDDATASLSVTATAEGKVLVHCHAGCDQVVVLDALRSRGLWPNGAREEPPPPKAKARKAKTAKKGADPDAKRLAVLLTRYFDYEDEAGGVLYQTVRKELADGTKRIYQQRIDALGRTVANLKGTRLVLYGLPQLIAAIDAGESIYIVEGEAKVSLLTEWGLTATTAPLGAGKWRAEFAEPFKRRRVPVVILPDNDEPGRKHAQMVAESLAPWAESIRIIKLPRLGMGDDVVDWAERGGSKELLLAFVEGMPPWEPSADPAQQPEPAAETQEAEPPEPEGEPEPLPQVADDAAEKMAAAGRPVIRLVGGELPRVIDEAEAALLAANCGLYQRGGMVVRAVACEVPAADERTTISHRIVQVRAAHVAEAMTAAAQFQRFDSRRKEWVAIDAPARIAETYLAREQWRLPILMGVITAPTLRPDGTVIDEPGYDAATGLLLDPGRTMFPPIPRTPSRQDALAAFGLLDELLGEFPFCAPADRTVALSGILTGLVRRSLPTAPLHAYTSPAAGTGKTLLVDIAAAVGTGHLCPVTSQGADETELEKRLDASLLAGDGLLNIDNIEKPLGGSRICQIITQQAARVRILGLSRNADVACSVALFATGNNLSFDGDLVRRVVVCSLDARVERPELRHFKRDPLAEIAENRGRFVAAGLTILRAYNAAGSPDPGPPLASFERWCRWVRDALCWLDLPDAAETVAKARGTDTRLAAAAAVLSHWHEIIGERGITANEVAQIAESNVNAGFRQALLTVAETGGKVNTRRFGKWLEKYKSRIVAGLRIVQDGEQHKVTIWKCERADMQDRSEH